MPPAYPRARPQARRRMRENVRVTEPIDEFSFLPEQAADAGVEGPLPLGERLSLQLPERIRQLNRIRKGLGAVLKTIQDQSPPSCSPTCSGTSPMPGR